MRVRGSSRRTVEAPAMASASAFASPSASSAILASAAGAAAVFSLSAPPTYATKKKRGKDSVNNIKNTEENQRKT